MSINNVVFEKYISQKVQVLVAEVVGWRMDFVRLELKVISFAFGSVYILPQSTVLSGQIWFNISTGHLESLGMVHDCRRIATVIFDSLLNWIIGICFLIRVNTSCL